MSQYSRYPSMLSMIALCSLAAGCFPVLHVSEDPRGRLRFVDQQTGRQVDRVLVISEFEDYFGWVGPDGAGGGQPNPAVGVKAWYLAKPRVWDARQELADHYSVATMWSALFFLLPIGYGGVTSSEGLVVVAPGYQTTYVPSNEVYRRLNGESDRTVSLAAAENPGAELEAARRLLDRGRITREEASAWRILNSGRKSLPWPQGAVIGIRFSSREWETVRAFLACPGEPES